MSTEHPDIFTYRGRTLEELVVRIRDDLGDDAVIVARREARTGGFAGFFARREVEVDVRASPPAKVQSIRPAMLDPDESPAARAFREKLEVAQARSADHDVVSDEFAGPTSAGDVDVHDLFPQSPAKSEYGEIFEPQEKPGQTWSAAGDADVIHLPRNDWEPPSSETGMERYAADLDEVLDAPLDHAESHPSDGLSVASSAPPNLRAGGARPDSRVGGAPQAASVPVELAEGPVAARRLTLPPTIRSTVIEPGQPVGQAAKIAGAVAERMIARGLDEDLAHRASAEAVSGLLPFHPDADVRELVARALAQHLPAAPLRAGAATAAFVGSGGSGKTRCVARLAAAYSRGGEMPITVVALKAHDGGDELRRLLSPYDVQLIAADSGVAAASELSSEVRGMVLIDTPAIVLRDVAARSALVADLAALAPDEVHVTFPATMSGEAARELLDALADLKPIGMTVTHCDETFQLGAMLGLSIERNLPISYVGQGQAVDGGLTPIATEALAAELLC